MASTDLVTAVFPPGVRRAGRRKTIDEYLEDNGIRVLTHRPDRPDRVFVKP